MSDLIAEFRAAMAVAGINWSGEILADKQRHRFIPDGKKSASGWYKLHPDGPVPAGAFGDWSIMEKGLTWHLKNGGHSLSKEEMAAFRKRNAELEESRKQEELDRWERRSHDAAEYIAKLPSAKDHGYLELKSVGVHGGLKFDAAQNFLVLPLEDEHGKIWSYQTIDFLGDKLFMPGARTRGLFFKMGEASDGPLIICEGYATGATIHQITDWPVVCAMNCGNLQPVCSAVREVYKDKTLVIAADDDRFTEKQGEPYNPGIEKAKEAAQVSRSLVAKPSFPADSTGTDFNDLARECGEGVVRGIFHTLIGIGMGQRIEIKDLLRFVPSEDKDSVIGRRYLCRGGSCVIVAQTSAGKSSLGMQMAVIFALGLPFFGLKPARPLKSVIVQAENDAGDTAEMLQGVLLGLELITGNIEDDKALVAVLEKNLIIIRDQTHVGQSFSGYAEKLVELHSPDLFWIDPLLSFYGDDINDQRAMSNFLRAELNPISERTGVIWMMLHHTGKPAKDAAKTQKHWSARDFSYMGVGSSELSNWARAIICLTATSEDEFRMIFAKRGWRAAIMDGATPVTELHLAYSSDHICWRQIPKPKEDEAMDSSIVAFVKSLEGHDPLTASQIVKLAAEKLQRGVRTCWRMWDSGNGELAKSFLETDGKYVVVTMIHSKPYADD